MMRESKKSLKIYFIVLGILNLLSGIIAAFALFVLIFGAADDISKLNTSYLDVIITLIFSFVIAGLFLYYGVKLYDYLQRSPKSLINCVIVGCSISFINGLLSLNFVIIIGSALVAWYLIHNIKKLSITVAAPVITQEIIK